MKFKLILILMLILLASGCIKKIDLSKYISEEKIVPVLYVNVTMEELNGIPAIAGIEAYGGEMSSRQAPKDVLAENFPLVYVYAVKSASKLTYSNAQKYVGPGVYRYTVGFENEFDRNLSLAVMAEMMDKNTTTIDLKGMHFNWSAELQSKSFK